MPWKLFRAGDGKTRVDYGNTSVITNPATQQTILLDHLKQEAHVIPTPKPAVPQMAMPQFGMPPVAAPGAAPQMPAVNVQDLGKGFIEGHEVEGKRYLIQPPAPPQPPPMPKPVAAAQAQAMARMPKPPQQPGMPQIPGMPQMPQPPQPPQAPPPPTAAEIWTSTQLKLPVLTKISGPSGQQNCYCKAAASGEPHPSLFQIPQGYKLPTKA
jgi:hypothetical protein